MVFDWLEDKVERVDKANWLYKILCFISFRQKRKFTYQELFLLLYGLNKQKLGDKIAKVKAAQRIMEIHNNQ